MAFAVDTNLLVYPTSRRLLHGVALECQEQLVILPEVEKELMERDNLLDAEVSRWGRRNGTPFRKLKETEQVALRKSLNKAINIWWNEFKKNPIIEVPQWTERDVIDSSHIAESIPSHVFNEKKPTNLGAGDRLIVSQAIHCDVELIGSNNLRTIDHLGLNRWLIDHGWNRKLIHNASDALEALEHTHQKDVYEWIIAHGMKNVYEDEQMSRDEFSKTLKVLASAGFRESFKNTTSVANDETFRTIIFNVRNQFDDDPKFIERVRDVIIRDRENREKALKSELRLSELVNQHVMLHEQDGNYR